MVLVPRVSAKMAWQYGADGLVQSATVEHLVYVSAALANDMQAIAKRRSDLIGDIRSRLCISCDLYV